MVMTIRFTEVVVITMAAVEPADGRDVATLVGVNGAFMILPIGPGPL